MDTWSDQRKWWMDFLKSLLIFGSGILVAALILNDRDDYRTKLLHTQQMVMDIKSKVLLDFLEASTVYYHKTRGVFEYTLLSDAIPNVLSEEGLLSKMDIKEWQQEVYPNVKAPIAALKVLFSENNAVLEAVKVYGEKLVNIKNAQKELLKLSLKVRKNQNQETWEKYRENELAALLKELQKASNELFLEGTKAALKF